jgi:hypothetical protein
MFAKGPAPGSSAKALALALLPKGATCQAREARGIRGYVVVLPDGQAVASAGTSRQAWENAQSWAERTLKKETK